MKKKVFAKAIKAIYKRKKRMETIYLDYTIEK